MRFVAGGGAAAKLLTSRYAAAESHLEDIAGLGVAAKSHREDVAGWPGRCGKEVGRGAMAKRLAEGAMAK